MEYGIQLYSVRDITETNMDGALKALSEMGYKTVEFAGFFGHTAREITDMLKKYRLTVSGTHSGWRDFMNNYEETVAYHKAIGNKNVIVPGTDLSCQKNIDEFVEAVNFLQPKLAKDGITLGYHNHAHEFQINEDGSAIYPQLVERTQLKLEIDTYWAYVGKQNPVEMMETLKGRVHFIHIKDGDDAGHGTPLGKGTAPVKAVYAKARELGIPMVVESETLTPDGLTEAKLCIECLFSMEK